MAVETGAIFKRLYFDGQSSGTYGVYITGEAVFSAPQRDVEMIKIPGRNGEFALDNGRFENIEVTYPAGIFADNEADFAEAISDFRNFLASRTGYCRLEDDYNPTEFRMAVYKSGLDVDAKVLKAGEFDITFDCKPQRWLKDGETAVTIGEWGETETVSGDIVSVDNPNGILAVKSLEVDLEPIQDLNGYDKPWVGGAGKNKLSNNVTNQTVNGITVTVSNDGVITCNGTATAQVAIVIGTFYGEQGVNYKISGMPSGSSTSKYFLNLAPSPETGGSDTNYYAEARITPVRDLTITARLYIRNGQTVSNLVFEPMIRLASETDATYEPYSNICPISGRTEVETQRTGKNLLNSLYRTYTRQNNVRYYRNGGGGLKLFKGVTYTLSVDESNTRPNGIYMNVYNPTSSVHTTLALKYNAYSVSFTPTEDVVIETDCYYVTAPTEGIENIKVQLEVGSATAYEPYQGETYTTDLGQTVYGGTLDVVSGVLTVDRASKELTSADTAQMSANHYAPNWRIAWKGSSSTAKAPSSTAVTNIMSNAFNAVSEANRGTAGTCFISGANSWIQFDISDTGINTSQEAYDYFFALNPQVVYELATPQTYQLTAQQISLLTGDNNIWSDSGDITLEYGQNPSVLFNPTLFESSPMLEVGGSGSIQFNGYEIEFAGIPYGEVVIADHMGYSSSSNPFTTTVTLDTSLLNTGDPIYLETKGCEIRATLKTSGSGYFRSVGLRNAPTNVLDTSTGISSNKKEAYLYMWPDFGEGFVYGTAKTLTCSAEYRYSVTSLVAYYEKVDVTIAYDGDDSVTVTISRSGTLEANTTRLRSSLSFPTMYGDSSKPNTAPIFIDCDLGEAYTNEGGVYRSMNQYIDLGSDLPTLGVGANEVTFDNTITELKVTPRYWKV